MLLSLGGETILLTAAHVADEFDSGVLMLPGREQLVQIGGAIHRRPLRHGESREDDAIDIAFVLLDRETAESLHPHFRPITWKEVGLFETLCEGDLYTFVGFPASRTRVSRELAQSEIFKYTGGAASDAEYSRIDSDPGIHIAMNFDIRKCVVDGRLQASVSPRGISGGGIFSWPKAIRLGPSNEEPKRLVGIAHTYRKQERCMVGTRINVCIGAVLYHYPDLNPLTQTGKRGAIPLAMVWYDERDWPRVQAEFADSSQMHPTFNEWRQAAQTGIETLRKRGVDAVPVPLRFEEIADYCVKTGQPNTGRTRSQLASRRLAEALSS